MLLCSISISYLFCKAYFLDAEAKLNLSNQIELLQKENNLLNSRITALDQTVDNLSKLNEAVKPISEPKENKTKQLSYRVSYLQQEANDKILLHQDIYFEGNKYLIFILVQTLERLKH